MAYNADNEKRTELASITKDNRGNILKICLIEKGDKRSLDVRDFWTNDDDEVLPSKKGVRIRDELALEAIVPMLEILELDELQEVADAIAQKLAASEEE